MFHPLAWVSWLVAALVALTSTRNPLYLGLILLWLGLTELVTRPVSPRAKLTLSFSPWRMALVIIPASSLFNALNVHMGATPILHLPASLPLIGGAVTLEAMLYGALNGLVLVGVLVAFAHFNQMLTVRHLVGLIPPVYYPLAVIVGIAITFAPVTLHQWQQIGEAQAIRGHQKQGVRSWLPLVLPLLLSSLERALQLAEAMTARGLASSIPTYGNGERLLLLVGLLSMVSGLGLRLLGGSTFVGWLGLVGGASLLVATLWVIGRRRPRAVYRPIPWRRYDGLVTLAALAVISCFLLPLPGVERASLYYYPYPALVLPGFNLWLGFTTWGLLLPALIGLPDLLTRSAPT